MSRTALVKHATPVIVLFAVGSGLSVALVVWLVSRTLAEVPNEDREYKDPPPLGFRLAWWPIHWLCPSFASFASFVAALSRYE